MQSEKIRVLLIDASEHDCEITCDLLNDAKELNLDVTPCATLHEGTNQLRNDLFDVIVVDLCLPDSKGLDTFLKLFARVPGTPIIVLTGMLYENLAIEAVRRGAQDCLLKGECDDRRLESSIYYAIERQKIRNSLTLQYATARALAETNDLEDVSMRVIQDICSVLHWDCGALFVHNAKLDVMMCKQFWADPMVEVPEFERDTRSLTFARGVGLPGRILESGSPEWVSKPANFARFPRSQSAQFDGIKAGFGFPIHLNGEVVAAIELYSLRQRSMDAHTMEMFYAIGGQFGQWMKRRYAEVELQEQSQVLQFILDSIPDGVVVADTNRKFLLFNPAAREMCGFGATDVPPTHWTTTYGCFYPDKVTPFAMEDLPLYRALNGESVDDVEMYLQNERIPNGCSVNISARPVCDETGKCIGGVVVLRDVTERKRIEEFRHEVNSLVDSDSQSEALIREVRRYLDTWQRHK